MNSYQQAIYDELLATKGLDAAERYKTFITNFNQTKDPVEATKLVKETHGN